MTHRPLRILGLAGSLRRASWNRRLLQAAAAQAPATLQLDVYGALASVPLFDEDLEQRDTPGPAGVQALRAALAAADAASLELIIRSIDAAAPVTHVQCCRKDRSQHHGIRHQDDSRRTAVGA